MAFAATWTAICGARAMPDVQSATAASPSGRRTAGSSAGFVCRKCAAISVLAGRSGIAFSWPRANHCTPFTSTHREPRRHDNDAMAHDPMTLKVPPKDGRRWDLVALGEVMLRFDPGEARIHTARSFRVWEGGGEYNVARGLKRCFGLDTALVSAFADNPVGRLVQDLIFQGGVDQSHVRWVKYDGVGREARNGLNFVERGFGIRAGVGCSDRGHTAVSRLSPGDIDFAAVFERDGARWLHSGGIFCALSQTTPAVAREAMEAARRCGAVVSFDLNYRESLWRANGGHARAIEVNRALVPMVDVLIGNEEDFSAALGFELSGVSQEFAELDPAPFR